MNCALCSDVEGGALPCDKVRKGKKSSDCPDDKIMANKKFFRVRASRDGLGKCIPFNESKGLLLGVAESTWKFPILGEKSLVITKAWVTHPHQASKPVGVFLFKRLVTHTCTGENPAFCTKGVTVADVHKVGYCVKCDFDVFPNIGAGRAKEEHRISFVTKCLPKAIDKEGNIKPAFRCSGRDMKYATASISGF